MSACASCRIGVLAGLVIALMFGCDRRPATSGAGGGAAAVAAPPEYELELKPLTPLAENAPTHIVVDSLGNICWVQETERKDDTLFIMGEGLIPRTTELSSMR